ncbi:DUF6471 domain-containing protein [Paralcaligenes sp. KSB-10]|uniref:DUF6471 domain-containing protein n=1 Tax=Paralcaligenes sp. KSB-10 TaxID=2901142 RepID=UPI001E639791|nr:DUF6471 domain-containing protein [Paralcaligenes sp. KSB-10]UHL63507.1 DUF6471 domain-containing protein [Paralcaligenes sp. KSB-10]
MTDSQTPAPMKAPRAKPKSAGLEKYEREVAGFLRALIAEKDLRLKTISDELVKRGIRESEKGLSAKRRKGTFSAAYLFAVQEVIEDLESRK